MPAGNGEQRGLQLWINLARKDKLCDPSYQELKSNDVPETTRDGINVRVIAGEALGVTSAIRTRTPTIFLDFEMAPASTLIQPIPEQYQGFIYTLEGKASYTPGDKETGAHYLLILAENGDHVEVRTSDSPARFVLIAGQPLQEPVVQYGPFVMSTEEEIMQTIEDFREGKNGFENAHDWRSLIQNKSD